MPDDLFSQTPQDLIAPPAPHDDAAAFNFTPAGSAVSDAGGASDASPATIAALANDLAYTVTVGQARELFAHHGRKIPAERTLQNSSSARSRPKKFVPVMVRSG